MVNHAKTALGTLDDAAEVACPGREHDVHAVVGIDRHPVCLADDGVDSSPQGTESNPARSCVRHVSTPQPKTSAL
jgi:hypothetical protein